MIKSGKRFHDQKDHDEHDDGPGYNRSAAQELAQDLVSRPAGQNIAA
jgi:hypothetical protein